MLKDKNTLQNKAETFPGDDLQASGATAKDCDYQETPTIVADFE